MATEKTPDDGPGSAPVSITAFGHRFENYPAALAENLITLEREGAIYSHFADLETLQPDGTAQFRYYRIALTPRETFEYVEASLAHQEFQLASRSFDDEAREFRSEDEWLEACLKAVTRRGIAQRVRDYDGYSEVDGEQFDLRGCLASFYPDGLEAVVCGSRHERYEEIPELETRDNIGLVMKILNNAGVAARSLEERQHGRPAFCIENEYDIQDLLYALIRSIFDDARREEWTPKLAGSAKRIDVVIPEAEVVLEVKYVRNKGHARTVADELRIDFETYHGHPYCKHLLAFVWDPNRHIADPIQFGGDLSGLRQKDSHSFEVVVLVR